MLYDANTLWLFDRVKGSKRALYHWDDPKKKFVGVVVAHHSAHIYYIADSAIWCVDLHTFATHRIASIPASWAAVSSLTVNADETELAGVYTEGIQQVEATLPRKQWVRTINRVPHQSLLFTIDLASGATHVIYQDIRWIDHPQFSPTDPKLLMFNLEIPAAEHKDTVFLIRSDGSHLRVVITRTEHGETLIHSFFGSSGKAVWYDLQSPWGRKYYIGASRVDGTGDLRYPIEPSEWSYHYNLSHREEMLAGDGNPLYADGKWLYLYRRQSSGKLQVEKLVNLHQQNYELEPNVQFSPDDQWILFRANFEGFDHPYLVRVAGSRSEPRQPASTHN